MSNLLRAEFFKLFKSKAFFICSLSMVGATIIMILTYKLLAVLYTPEMLDALSAQMEGSGLTSSGSEVFMTTYNTVTILPLSFTGNSFQLLIAIFTAIFVAGEYSCGAMKATASKGYSRMSIFASKFISTAVAADILVIIGLISTVIFATIIFGFGEVPSGFASDMALFLLVQFVLNLGVSSLFVAISTLVRNMGGCIAITIGISSFLPMILSLIDLVIQKLLPDLLLSISSYWIVQVVAETSTLSLTSSLLTKGLVTGILYTLFSFIIGAASFQVRDIN